MYETKQSKPPQILTLILLQTYAKDEREIKAIERTMEKKHNGTTNEYGTQKNDTKRKRNIRPTQVVRPRIDTPQ